MCSNTKERQQWKNENKQKQLLGTMEKEIMSEDAATITYLFSRSVTR